MRRFFLLTLLPLASVAAALPDTATVRKGETLYRIATRHGLSVDELRRLNGLKTNLIEVGQVLRLTPANTSPAQPVAVKPVQAKPAQAKPAQAKPAPARATPPARPASYAVRQGDTLAKISPRVGLSVDQLRRLNSLKGDALEAGQVLRLAWPTPPKPSVAPNKAAPPATYTVRPGDTLAKISPRVGLSVDQLRRLNSLKMGTLLAGQVLRLKWPVGSAPRPPTPPGTYVVRPGDTLAKISPRVGLSVDQLRRLNSLKTSTLLVGQVLRLKWPTSPKVAKKAAPPTTYTVRAGDTLTRISPRVGLGVDQLRRLNGLRDDRVTVGQVLRLRWPAPPKAPAPKAAAPKAASTPAPVRYVVRAGDTLGGIAARFGVSVERLQAANGLRGTVIGVGQTLQIPARAGAQAGMSAERRPAPLPPGTEARLIYRYVRVGLRDTAASLARTYRVTPEELRRINGFSARRVIMPGMRILVPQRVAVAVPPRPLRAPVTLRRAAPLGIPVQVVQVDLRHRSVLVSPVLPRQGLDFGAGARVSVLAARSGAQAVVNGSYFHPGSYAPAGDIVMQGRMLTWGRIPAALAITPDNRAQISPSTSALLGRPLESTWSGMETVIATGPQIVRGGAVQSRYSPAFRDPAVFGQAARSAVGLSSSRDLLLVSTHAKLSTVQMGQVMAALGARDALLLDGGSSAGLAWNGAAVLDSVRKVSYGIGVFSNYTGRRYSR